MWTIRIFVVASETESRSPTWPEATAEAALPLVLRAPAPIPRDIVTVLVLVVAGHGGVGHVIAGLRAQTTRLPAVLSKAVAVSSCQPGANLFICEVVIASVAQMPRHTLTEATVLAAAPLHVLPEAGVLPVSLAARPLVGAVVGGVGGHTLGARAQPAALLALAAVSLAVGLCQPGTLAGHLVVARHAGVGGRGPAHAARLLADPLVLEALVCQPPALLLSYLVIAGQAGVRGLAVAQSTRLLALVLVSPALAPGLVAVVARVPAVPPVARWPGGLELVSRPQLYCGWNSSW